MRFKNHFKHDQRITMILIACLSCLFVQVAWAVNDNYERGQDALKQQQWQQAVDAFRQSIKQEEDAIDAAYYWQAYALFASGQNRAAKRAIRALMRNHPDSKWIDDAEALLFEHDEETRNQAITDVQLDDELRLFALQQLMHSRPEKAMPLLTELLESSQSSDVKRHTMFILGTSGHEDASRIIAQYARSSDDVELQMAAIQTIAQEATEENMTLLRELYRSSNNAEIKRSVINSFIIADDARGLVDLTRNESNPDLWRQAVNALGAMEATGVLKSLYEATSDLENKRTVIQSMAVADDVDGLKQILDSETSAEIKRAVIQSLGILDETLSEDYWRELYDSYNDEAIKTAVIEALSIQEETAEVLYEIASREAARSLQQRAIQALAVNEAEQQLSRLYQSLEDLEVRMEIIQSMGILETVEGLEKIIETETNSALRLSALRSLGINDSDAAGDILLDSYNDADTETRKVILQSLMVQHNAHALIQLMQSETDPQLKRDILQQLSLIDDDEASEYLLKLLEKDS